jgi:hypothetical protein
MTPIRAPDPSARLALLELERDALRGRPPAPVTMPTDQ